jgi:hypothetical protein
MIDLRIVSLKPTGGSNGQVDFRAEISNYGTTACRANVSADLDGEGVRCEPAYLDLAPGGKPERVTIVVPRSSYGELMHACNDDTTLYGATLTVRASASGKDHARPRTWKEELYDPENDRGRYEAQQAVWAARPPGHGQSSPRL